MNEISVLNAISATLSYDKVSLITRGKKNRVEGREGDKWASRWDIPLLRGTMIDNEIKDNFLASRHLYFRRDTLHVYQRINVWAYTK